MLHIFTKFLYEPQVTWVNTRHMFQMIVERKKKRMKEREKYKKEKEYKAITKALGLLGRPQ